jgi:predicted nucleic acid-binding Zn ribbon protein
MDILGKQMHEGPNYCHFCDEPIFGRSDKKFCNDSCRNRFHAQAQRRRQWAEPNFVGKINRALMRNRRLLAQTIPHQKKTVVVLRTTLEEKGFEFGFYTNVLATQKGSYHYCYEYGWLAIAPNKVLVVKTHIYDDYSFC